jgi:monovalent cation:H+ antiporter-2, CPA2 family
MQHSLLGQAVVYLAAAMVVVPIASRLGLGSVLGYLLGGVVIGPHLFNLVGNADDVMHFAELGVVMMLFLVGLELEPSRLWRLRGPIFGMGGLQVVLSAAVLMPLGLAMGMPWQQALALGLILAMSSTAIALQTLKEKGLMGTDAGQKSFSVLLFQDVAVIPMLALFPLLATLPQAATGSHGESFLDHIGALEHTLLVVVAIAVVIAAGRFLVRPMMRAVARTGLRELFTGAALFIVLGVTLLMTTVGLSPALGTFLAGVVLASSEFRHELESDVEPFKGLLLGLFFLAVGASIDFPTVASQPVLVAGLVIGVSALKALVLLGLGLAFKAQRSQALIFAVALCQVGEFAFVLLNFARGSGVLAAEYATLGVAVTALSMAVSPISFVLVERLVLPRLQGAAPPPREADQMDEHNDVIVAGFGRFGQVAARFLQGHGHACTLLDVDSDQIEVVARFGGKVFFGDASRLDLLRSAGASHAKVLIIAVDDPVKVNEIAHMARTHFPHLSILARARGRGEAMQLVEHELEGVYRETFDSALRAGVDALRLLGTPAAMATRAARIFARHDEDSISMMAEHRKDQARLVHGSRERTRLLEEALRADGGVDGEGPEHAWDTSVRSVVKPDSAD